MVDCFSMNPAFCDTFDTVYTADTGKMFLVCSHLCLFLVFVLENPC